MRVTIIGNEKKLMRYKPNLAVFDESDKIFIPQGTDDDTILRLGGDCEALVVNAVTPVSSKLIRGMDKLKLIQCEGVGFNRIDCETARERGVLVCNNAGVNAALVAEHTVMMMIGLCHDIMRCNRWELEGDSGSVHEMVEAGGMWEMAGRRVGLIGFGNIGQAVAERLIPFGCELYYWNRTRKPELEEKLGIKYASLDEIASGCDIVSLHVAVSEDTAGMINEAFISKMKPTALLVNTARGEIVDNDALKKALDAERIAGAAFDTISPEPTPKDHPLLNISPEGAKRLIYSPHIAGLSTGMYTRSYRRVWENIEKVKNGERPLFVVNGLYNEKAAAK